MKKGKKTFLEASMKEKGITLIALVITIVILIILSTVTINAVLGENGLIKQSEKAKDIAEESKRNEEQEMVNAAAYMNEILGGIVTDEPDEPEMSITDAKNQENGMAEKTIVIDEKNNKIMVPKGFKIANDSGNTVQQGIVIEDVTASTEESNVRGSQYVWIPVGTFVKDNGSTSNEIKLARYTFNTSSPGTPTPVQLAKDYTTNTVISIDDVEYTESSTYDEGFESMSMNGRNGTAKNLKAFIDSTKPISKGGNGGYYIGRYEASYASGATSTTIVGDYTKCKAASKISESYSNSMTYTIGRLWNYITQPAASKVAVNTYEESGVVKSDLMNSYAWDTAIVYIQEAGNTNYANQNSKNSSLANTGTNNDEVCKINDMASNVWEWTTEHSNFVGGDYVYPCMARGGGFTHSNYYTARRDYGIYSSYSYTSFGFRFVLYITV